MFDTVYRYTFNIRPRLLFPESSSDHRIEFFFFFFLNNVPNNVYEVEPPKKWFYYAWFSHETILVYLYFKKTRNIRESEYPGVVFEEFVGFCNFAAFPC